MLLHGNAICGKLGGRTRALLFGKPFAASWARGHVGTEDTGGSEVSRFHASPGASVPMCPLFLSEEWKVSREQCLVQKRNEKLEMRKVKRAAGSLQALVQKRNEKLEMRKVKRAMG